MVITADLIGFGTLSVTMVSLVVFTLNQSRYHENGRKSIYKRMDQQRENTAKTYVRQDIHNTEYKVMKEDVTEIKGDVKKLLMKNGIR